MWRASWLANYPPADPQNTTAQHSTSPAPPQQQPARPPTLVDVVKRVRQPVTDNHDVAAGPVDDAEGLPHRGPLGPRHQAAAAGGLAQSKGLQAAQAPPDALTRRAALLQKLIHCVA